MFYEVEFPASATIFVDKIDKFAFNIRSFNEPLGRSVRQVLVPDIKRKFDTGSGWKPLAPSTVLKKQRLGRNKGILKETGALARAATQISQWKVTKDSAYFAGLPSTVSYGYPQDMGFRNARTGTMVPAREFISISKSQEEAIFKTFDQWVDERRQRTLG